MLIGLGYKKRAGKDLVADHLVKRHGFTKVGMVSLMKEAMKVVYGWDDRHTEGDLKEVVCPYWGFTPRWAMEQFGDATRGEFGADFWVRAVKRHIDQIRADGGRVVVNDMRLPLEADVIREWGGQVWRIDRDGLPPPGNHPTETALADYEDWDHVLTNNGTKFDLIVQANRLIPDSGAD